MSFIYVILAVLGLMAAVVIIPSIIMLLCGLAALLILGVAIYWATGSPIVIKVDGMRVGELRWFTYYPDYPIKR